MIFTPAYKHGGGAIEAHEYYIPTATAIVKGETVGYTVGTGVVAYDSTDADDPILGIAAEDHAANSGTKIKIYDDPAIVFKCIPVTVSTVDSGSTTTWVDAEYTAADDVFNLGKIVITNANSVAGFAVGDVLEISDYANSTGTFTVSGAGGTIAAGMQGIVYPGKLAVAAIAFDAIATTFNNIDTKTAGGETFKIVDVVWSPAKKQATIFFKIRLHLLGNSTLAL